LRIGVLDVKGARSIVVLLALAAVHSVNAASPDPSKVLIGLWKAERHFGPAARGTLIIEQSGDGWWADIVGRHFPIQFDGTRLGFTLPDAAGEFTGRLLGGGRRIVGHWIQPHSVIHGFQYATPVRLSAIGPDRWKGTVAPVDDDCTFYLLVRREPDGTVGAVLRNPQRNFGLQYGIDRLILTVDGVVLTGASRGSGQAARLRGAFDPVRGMLSIEFPEQGGRYDFVRDTGSASGFYPRGQIPVHYQYHVPPAVDDDWATGSLETADVDRAGVERFVQTLIDMPIESVHSPEVEALLIARHGQLILEEYFHDFSRETLHDTRSAAKSITAVVVGAAMQAGAPLALSTPVYQLMSKAGVASGLSPWRRAMTLADLLTMRSGYYCNDSDPAAPGNEDKMIDAALAGTGDPDFYHYILRVPMAYAPDTVSIYCSTNPNLALGMVGEALRESPLDTFDRLLGGPLKIEHYAWPLDGVGHPYGGGGVRIRPRDFLKLGQLMLNGGLWRGRRILAADFAAHATAPLHDLNGIQYGLLWWSIEYPYKERSVRAYFAGGNGGQGVLVVPALDLVVGIFAGNYGDRVGLHVQQDLVPDFILPAVREPGDDRKAPVIERDFHTPYAHPPVVAPATLEN